MPLLSISFQLFHLVCHKSVTTPFICYVKRFIVVLFCFKLVRRCDIGVCYTKCYPNTFYFYFHYNIFIHIGIKCCLIKCVCIFVNLSFAIYSLKLFFGWTLLLGHV